MERVSNPHNEWEKSSAGNTPARQWHHLTNAEREIIDFCEKVGQRKLTPQEVNLALMQARDIGELEDESE
jgi:hypothetical protein